MADGTSSVSDHAQYRDAPVRACARTLTDDNGLGDSSESMHRSLQRSAAQRSAARRTRVYLHLPTLPMLVQSQNYTAWWISHFGLKWASRIAFGVPTDLIDVATGIALGLPTYWALTRRVRPTVHANLHRFINTEKDIRQWMEQQLVLTVEMVSLNLQREFPPLH